MSGTAPTTCSRPAAEEPEGLPAHASGPTTCTSSSRMCCAGESVLVTAPWQLAARP